LKSITLSEKENFIHLKNIEEYLKDPHAWFRRWSIMDSTGHNRP
jgi:hypothetical protein